MSNKKILVTGAAGNIGSIGTKVVENLISKGYSVRAMVRRIDERSDRLDKMGAEVVVGDLTSLEDVKKVVKDVSRIYFSMSPSSSYLDATAIMAAVVKSSGDQRIVSKDFDMFVNMSQMTVSSMDINKPTDSQQQRNHWLSEQILSWSGLPVVEIRPTVFMEHPFFALWASESIKKDNTVRLPFGDGKTSPIATSDIANCISIILSCEDPSKHVGKIYQLTGPKSENMYDIAKEYSIGMGREIKYIDIPFEEWYKEKETTGLDKLLLNHFEVMTKLHKANRYDRYSNGVELLTDKKPMSISQWIKTKPDLFKSF